MEMKILNLNEFWSPVILSLKVTFVSSFFVFIVAIFIAWAMAKKTFFGKSLVETFLMLPLVLPPTVVGFILLMLLGRKSWFGQWIEWWFNQPILFTWWAAVIASSVVAFPLVYQTLKVGFLSVDKELVEYSRTSGANDRQILTFVILPLASRSLIAGYILGFARALGEFGATLMIAGNIPNRTQTLPTAIYIAVDSGKLTLAWLWVGTMILISFLMLWLVNVKTK